jgi:hypothetical protein
MTVPRRYRDVVMPDRFVLECLTETGDWIAWGHYTADGFDREHDGTCVGRTGARRSTSAACAKTAS